MPRTTHFDKDGLRALLERDEMVVSHHELRALGFPVSTATHRCRSDGPWQAYLPGIVITHSGQPTARQRERAAVKYAGDGAVLTGAAALRRAGVPRVPPAAGARVLIPHQRHRQSRPEVLVERTRRMPEPRVVLGLPCAPVARAVIDECRQLRGTDAVRNLVAHVVQTGHCTVKEIEDEVKACQRRGSGLPRLVLHEVSAGIRSVAEAKVRQVLQAAGLGRCEWNLTLLDASGLLIATPDGWFDAEAVALEIDSIAWHLDPEGYQRTQERQRRMTAAGILVVPVTPNDVLSDPAGFLRDVVATLAGGAGRRRPDIRAVRTSQE